MAYIASKIIHTSRLYSLLTYNGIHNKTLDAIRLNIINPLVESAVHRLVQLQ